LITRPEESYRLWRVVVCDQETSNGEAKASYGTVENTTTMGCNGRETNKQIYIFQTDLLSVISSLNTVHTAQFHPDLASRQSI